MNKVGIIALIIVALAIIGGIIYFVANQNSSPVVNNISQTKQLSTQPTLKMNPTTPASPSSELAIDPAKQYIAVLTTSAGNITLELTAKATPLTVNNFVTLARKNFYDNTIFHRIIKGFMIQGGDPNGNGTGGPGYNIPDEPVVGEYTRGTIAMANTGRPNSGGSQFFIMHQNYDLPKTYTIFGRVTSGIEVVDAIANASVSANLSSPGENSKPLNPVSIKTITITEK